MTSTDDGAAAPPDDEPALIDEVTTQANLTGQPAPAPGQSYLPAQMVDAPPGSTIELRAAAGSPPPAPDDGHNCGISPKRIRHLAELTDDWDSYGGAPPTAEAMVVARTLCTVPTSNGGLQLEWHANGWDVEIEVGPDGAPEFWAQDRTTGRMLDAGPPPTNGPTRQQTAAELIEQGWRVVKTSETHTPGVLGHLDLIVEEWDPTGDGASHRPDNDPEGTP